MSAPTILTAGSPTPGRLWTPEVKIAGTYTPIQYVEQCDFNPDAPSLQDSTIYGDAGFSGQDKMGAAWSATITVNRMTVPGSSPVAYDPAQEYLRTHSIGQFGAAARVEFRIYEYDTNDPNGLITPRVEAYHGFASVSWPGNGGVAQDAERTVAIGLAGKGKLDVITHPYPPGTPTPVVPTLTGVTPASIPAAGGVSYELDGSAFTGVTGVTIGGTAVTSFRFINDGRIIGVAPAHATGTGLPVVVTNATGPSSGGPTVAYV